MEIGRLYFVKDTFYKRFHDCKLMENREVIDGKPHKRPCCYLFEFLNIYWMIPISSKVEKYKVQYQKAMRKYSMCDNISFGYVLGEEKAFLVQNLFPVTEEYINSIYIDKNTGKPIVIPNNLIAELNKKARKKSDITSKEKYLV